MPSPGLATPGTLESQVSPDLRTHSTASLIRPQARMCHAYQQLNEIGISEPVSAGERLKSRPFADIAKNVYQNITEEKLRLVQFLLRREQGFQKDGQQLSASIEVRYSHEPPQRG